MGLGQGKTALQQEKPLPKHLLFGCPVLSFFLCLKMGQLGLCSPHPCSSLLSYGQSMPISPALRPSDFRVDDSPDRLMTSPYLCLQTEDARSHADVL